MRTTAAVVRSPGGPFEVEEIRLDGPRADEVLVEIKATGICHMDVEATGMLDVPCVLGHEGAGVVIETGADVVDLQPGDRVILGYGFCGCCSPCANSQPFFCDDGWTLTFGGRRADGSATAFDADEQPLAAAFFQQSSFARHALTPARSCVPIADSIPWPVAAAIPCGFMTGVGSARNVLAVGKDSSLLVSGVGAVGLGAIVGAKMQGCSTIVAVDVKDNRLELAEQFGATATINPLRHDLKEWCSAHLPRGFTHALDSTGNAMALETAIGNLATGGELAYAILPAPMEDFSFKPFELFVKCASFKAVSFGSAVPAELLPTMLDWWAAGDFPVESVLREFDFADINAAIAATTSGDVVKPVLVMD